MSTLGANEEAFVARHRISPLKLFDATGLTSREYKLVMKDLGKTFAFGVSPCRNGHALKTRHGHCVMCDPAKIAFAQRHSNEGFVYIFGSLSEKVLKVGVTSDVDQRIRSLNYFSYGGASD